MEEAVADTVATMLPDVADGTGKLVLPSWEIASDESWAKPMERGS